MTPEQITMVQESFTKVEPIADKAADIFYDRLFETTPEVRKMFPADMTAQKESLMQTITVAVNNLHQVETIVDTVKELGAKHVGYGVKNEHYDSVGSALLYTLEAGLGDDWNDELKEAWTATYTLVADTMKEGAASVPPIEEKTGLFSKFFKKLVPA